MSVTGNITGGNLNAAGLSLSGNVVNVLNVDGTIAGGNVTTPGLISATGTITSAGNITGANVNGTSGVYSGGVQVLTINDTVDGGTY